MSGGIAATQLRSFVERIERLEEEVKELNRDKSDVYQEAKGNGFDLKALRAVVAMRRKDADELSEHNAIVDLYLSALGMELPDPSHVHVHTRVEIIEEIPPHDPETGEVIEDRGTKAGDTGFSHPPVVMTRTVSAGQAADESPATVVDGGSRDAFGHQNRSASAYGGKARKSEGGNQRSAERSGEGESDAETPQRLVIQDASPPSTPAPDPDAWKRQYRPHCQRPDTCAGLGLKHCHACAHAAQAMEAA